MSKLKPSWVKTDIPKSIKVQYLWKAMMEAPTYTGWQQALAKMEWPEEYDKYCRTSQDTYKSLQDEVREMPETEIRTLPDDLKAWIGDVRGIPWDRLNDTKRVLGEQVEPQTDPNIAKAKEDHLAEIYSLLKDLLDNMPYEPPHLTDEYPFHVGLNFLPLNLNRVTSEPLFESLREHIPHSHLWPLYSKWEGQYSDCIRFYTEVRNEIRTKGCSWPNVQLTEEFEEPILMRLSEAVANLPDDAELGLTYREFPGRLLVGFKWGGRDRTVLTYPPEMKVSHTMEYQALCDEILTSWTEKLGNIYNELWDIQEELRSSLQEVILQREHVLHTCRLCPGQHQLP